MILFILSIVVGAAVLSGYLYLECRKKVKKVFDESLPERGLPDYNSYQMTGREKLGCRLKGAVFIFGLAYTFYHSVFLALLFAPLGFLYPRLRSRGIIKRRKQELGKQFSDALYSLASSLNAGKSIEMAIKGVPLDLALLYPDPDTFIIREFQAIYHKLEMNKTVEEGLIDFAKRAHLEDIDNFVDVFITSKRSGGNLIKIIKNTSDIIGDKLLIKQEMETLLAQRRFEQRVLNIMPPLLILFLTWTTGDYMEPVFSSPEGRLIMTIALVLLGAAYYISAKIMSIEV